MGVNPYSSDVSGAMSDSTGIDVMKKAMSVDQNQMQGLMKGLEASTQPSQLAAQTSGLGANLNVRA